MLERSKRLVSSTSSENCAGSVRYSLPPHPPLSLTPKQNPAVCILFCSGWLRPQAKQYKLRILLSHQPNTLPLITRLLQKRSAGYFELLGLRLTFMVAVRLAALADSAMASPSAPFAASVLFSRPLGDVSGVVPLLFALPPPPATKAPVSASILLHLSFLLLLLLLSCSFCASLCASPMVVLSERPLSPAFMATPPLLGALGDPSPSDALSAASISFSAFLILASSVSFAAIMAWSCSVVYLRSRWC